MKKAILSILLGLPFIVIAQQHSWDGYGFKPNEKIHFLNIFVNIIYDVHPDTNIFNNPGLYWPTVTDPNLEGINTAAIPTYLLDWMDTVYIPSQLQGSCTRLYGESSFDSLQITGDFVVVNLKESTVLNRGSFNVSMIKTIVNEILMQSSNYTLFGHHSYGDFNARNYLIRNITLNYGGLNPGSGSGGNSTTQCVGDGDISSNPTNIVTHEISHGLFGYNNFHTSGGNHRGSGCPMPFLNIQGGYGLMGAAESGLVCCNGYERWRMHWKHPQAVDYISARNAVNTQSVVSDISREDGNKTFLLRDFVTYGDAVRIKLPYKDSVTSSNQYIWLENHLVGSNNKLDFLQYSNTQTCRPQGAAGIYAYYQIGRDVLESPVESEVWDSYHRDNLKIIPAEGYYDYELVADTHNVQCVAYDDHYYAMRRGTDNPLCGGQDQEYHLFPAESDNLLYTSCELEMWRKKVEEHDNDSLPMLGDDRDAFSTHTRINMGTNPSTNNAKTCHSNNQNPSNVISAKVSEKNVQTTYLTGLSIEMTPVQGTGDFLVNIRWDDYDITNDTRWTGKIALKDTAVLTAGNTVTLAQNRTVAQPTRDPETGLFAGRTRWTCESGSYFRQDSASALVLTESSSLTFENGSRYELSEDAHLEVGAGCSLTVMPGAKVRLKGFVEVDSGGVLTLYDTAGMGSLARLIVRPGGKLVVDGGTLTSAGPNEMWQGIEVVGNRTKRQFAQYQGTVELRNGATVANAHTAIATRLGEDNWFTSGGIIKAVNAHFINNRRSVEFLSYVDTLFGGFLRNNYSYFKDCTFTLTPDNPFSQNGYEFIDHVTLWQVKGVRFYHCSFSNLSSGTDIDRRHAIYAVDAGFAVTKDCLITQPDCLCEIVDSLRSSFTGFTAAVEVATSGDQFPVTIDHAMFSNNSYGVKVNGNHFVSLTRCDFDLQEYPIFFRNWSGLHLDHCTGYLVEENTFRRNTYSSQFPNSTGIYVTGSGNQDNLLHRNLFHYLDRSVYATGNNRGLRMTCNLFYENEYGIYSLSDSSVSLVQGAPDLGAGNIFSNNKSKDFRHTGQTPVSYYYSSGGIFCPSNSYGVTPISATSVNPCASTLCSDNGGGIQPPPPGPIKSFAEQVDAYIAASGDVNTDGGFAGANDDLALLAMRNSLSGTYYDAVRAIMADSVLDVNELERWHAAAQPLADPYSLAETRFMMGYSDPFSADADNAELANYAEFHALKLALRGQYDNTDNQDNNISPAINWYALTDLQIAQLRTIAERNAGRASVMAKGILCFFHGICYEDEWAEIGQETGDTSETGDTMETRAKHAAMVTDASDASLRVYPNPTGDLLSIEMDGAGIVNVALYDLQGRPVGANNHSPLRTGANDTPLPGTSATMDLHDIPAGVYILRVTATDGHEHHQKIVKR